MYAWCGCVCMDVGVYVRVWVCMHGCKLSMCAWVWGVGVYAWVPVCMYVYAWVCMGVGVYAWMRGTVCRGMKGDS